MEAPQSPHRHTVLHGTVAHPQLPQLATADDAVLTCRKLSHPHVDVPLQPSSCRRFRSLCGQNRRHSGRVTQEGWQGCVALNKSDTTVRQIGSVVPRTATEASVVAHGFAVDGVVAAVHEGDVVAGAAVDVVVLSAAEGVDRVVAVAAHYAVANW